MLPAAKEGAMTVGGAAGGFKFPDAKAGANTAVGGAELTTPDIVTVGWYCGGGGSCDGCTVSAKATCEIGCPV